MMKKTALAAAITAAVAWSGSAFAHELECRKTVNDVRYYEVDSYPDELDYRLVVRNIHPSLPSDVLGLEDTLLENLDAEWFEGNEAFEFDPDAPFTLGLNEHETYHATVQIRSYEQCLELAAEDGTADSYIDNYFTVEWDSGEDVCHARVKCVRPPPPPPEDDVSCRKVATIIDNETGLPILNGNTVPAEGGVYIRYRLVVRNDGETDVEITDLEDSLLEGLPAGAFVGGEEFVFDPDAPFTLEAGTREVYGARLDLTDANRCQRLDPLDGADDGAITNVFTVTWDGGSDVCREVVYCTPPPPPPDGCNNRTLGFFKTHFGALEACFREVDATTDYDAFPGDMDSADDLAALLWTTPSSYENPLDKARFLLARQLAVAICNVEVFESEPIEAIWDALDALQGTDCHEIRDLAGELDDWNNSCEGEQDPHGFGRADPQYSAEQAAEGTNPIEDNSGQVCGGSVTLN